MTFNKDWADEVAGSDTRNKNTEHFGNKRSSISENAAIYSPTRKGT